MDPRYRQLLRSKDYIQLRQQVKAYPPFFSVITIFHACEHYHYYYLQVFVQFLYVKKNAEFLLKMPIVLCSSLI